MTHTRFRNVSCFAGLAIGVLMIMSAEMAHADIRPCTEEEAGPPATDTDLPILCEVMTVTGERPGLAEALTANAAERPEMFRAAFRDVVIAQIEAADWRIDQTS
jgi:hypothetical protein